MADTGAPWNIAFRGDGELGQPINLITEEIAQSVHTALNEATGTGSAYTALPAATGWTPSGGYVQLGKLIIAHFQWLRTGADITNAAASLGTLPAGVRPLSAFVRTILYNSSVGVGGIQPRLTVGT